MLTGCWVLCREIGGSGADCAGEGVECEGADGALEGGGGGGGGGADEGDA